MPSTSNQPARVRFAPSPTGRTHLGSGRTALYDYLLARQTGGQFILRIEDTDQKRYVPGAKDELIESLRWLGLEWDEGPDVGGPNKPYHQSERREIYQHYAQQLVESGHAYPCFCSPERLDRVRKQQQEAKRNPRYDGQCRQIDPDEAAKRITQGENHVIRFKTPLEGSTSVKDRLRGEISVENKSLDDYILIKSDGLAVYHLAAMVDDHLMGITHVIRGSEWLPTFPLHGLIYKAFGWEEPEWVHLSIFLKPSGKGKMSKRESAQLMKGGKSIFIKDLEALGYVPEAVVNWIALMGWSYDDHTEFFTMEELIDKFSLERLNPSPAAINFSKLDHFNGLHIRNMSIEELATRIKPFFQLAGYNVKEEKLEDIASSLQIRMQTLDEAPEKAGFFFKEEVQPKTVELIGKKMSAAQSANAAQQAHHILESLDQISPETAEEPLRNLADQLGIKAGQLFGILRVAVTGQKVSPPLFESMAIIGKEKVLERVNHAVTMLRDLATRD
jgi:glutamyl-tRNA synthetase